MSKEAMKQALEALEKISRTKYYIETPPVESLEEQMRRIADRAITAIKQVRSAPVQEPVAWSRASFIEDDDGRQIGTDEPEISWGKEPPDEFGWSPHYTIPQQREWVGLTDEEIIKIRKELHPVHGHLFNSIEFARKIEAKLKEKNT